MAALAFLPVKTSTFRCQTCVSSGVTPVRPCRAYSCHFLGLQTSFLPINQTHAIAGSHLHLAHLSANSYWAFYKRHELSEVTFKLCAKSLT